MSIFINNLILTATLVLTLVLLFKNNEDKKHILEEDEEESSSSIDKLLDKFILDENRDLMKEKFTKTSEIIAKTQDEIEKKVKKKIKVAEDHYKFKHKEKRQIKKAGKIYDAWMAKLVSAMPTTEEERLADIKELKVAISLLESYDEESYRVGPKKSDAGAGIFYDKMSREFKSLINEHKLNNYKLIPIQRLKYHVLLNIKNLNDEDILPILIAMKDTKMLSDIIEINPTFYVIVFGEEKLDFSHPEKVLLTFAYDEELTLRKLLELTEWNEEYAKNVIKSLSDKGLVTSFDDKIIVGGFGQIKDRKMWNDIIEEIFQKAKVKESEKQKRQMERKQQLKQQLSKVEKMKIPPAKVKNMSSEKQKLQEEQKIIDKDALVGAMEALDDMMPVQAGKDLKSEEQSLENQISERILEYYEKFSLINGGLAQYEKIKEYVNQELEVVSDKILKTVLNQLIELQMIVETIKIGKYDFYLFNKISLSISQKNFLKFAINKKAMKRKDFIVGLKWNEQKALLTMRQLQQKGILMLAQQNILIPGIIQKK